MNKEIWTEEEVGYILKNFDLFNYEVHNIVMDADKSLMAMLDIFMIILKEMKIYFKL